MNAPTTLLQLSPETIDLAERLIKALEENTAAHQPRKRRSKKEIKAAEEKAEAEAKAIVQNQETETPTTEAPAPSEATTTPPTQEPTNDEAMI